jgi:hypothetical protein
VVTPDGIIIQMKGPYEGCRHDSGILAESGLHQILQTHCNDEDGRPFCLYGDPAYGVSRHVLSPYKGAVVTEEQKQFNKAMSKSRISVEWEFGDIVREWAFLDFKKNQKVFLQPLAKYYLTGAILSNIRTCVNGSSQTSIHFNVDPPSLAEYLGTILE